MAPVSTIRLAFPSEVRFVDLVHETAEKLAGVAGLAEDQALDVGIAVRETVINAIVHGNRRDASIDVEVAFEVEEGGMTTRVVDQGAGFDPDATPDPRTGENRLKTSGRGLLLVRAFVDEVSFARRNGGGMEVTLRKRVNSMSRPSGTGA